VWIQNVPGGGVRALAYSPDGRTLYTRDADRWVTAWDVQDRTGTRLVRAGGTYYPSHPEPGFGTADRGQFLVADGLPPYVIDLGTGESYRFDTGALRLPNPADPNEPLELGAGVGLIQPDPFAPRLLAFLPNGVVASWDLATRRPGADLGAPRPELVGSRFRPMPDGRALFRHRSNSSAVSLFDAAAGGFTTTFEVRCPAPNFEPLPAPDGRTALLFCGRGAFLWDRAASEPRARPVKAGPPLAAVAFHPTQPVFVAPDGDKVLTLFSTETGEPIRSLDFGLGKKVTCVAFSPDGLTCAVGGSNKQFAVFDVDL
jgi:WD40 repeat protein